VTTGHERPSRPAPPERPRVPQQPLRRTSTRGPRLVRLQVRSATSARRRFPRGSITKAPRSASGPIESARAATPTRRRLVSFRRSADQSRTGSASRSSAVDAGRAPSPDRGPPTIRLQLASLLPRGPRGSWASTGGPAAPVAIERASSTTGEEGALDGPRRRATLETAARRSPSSRFERARTSIASRGSLTLRPDDVAPARPRPSASRRPEAAAGRVSPAQGSRRGALGLARRSARAPRTRSTPTVPIRGTVHLWGPRAAGAGTPRSARASRTDVRSSGRRRAKLLKGVGRPASPGSQVPLPLPSRPRAKPSPTSESEAAPGALKFPADSHSIRRGGALRAASRAPPRSL